MDPDLAGIEHPQSEDVAILDRAGPDDLGKVGQPDTQKLAGFSALERLDALGLADNTILIFMTDNGTAAGAKFNGLDSEAVAGFNAGMRGKKASYYEGGHRVPFLVAWPSGGVGDGDESTPGRSDENLIGLQDLYATFAAILDEPLPNLREGEKGAEDSVNTLAAWQGEPGNAEAARSILLHRAHLNSLASSGDYQQHMEQRPA